MFFRKKKSAAKFVPVALPAPAEPDMDSRKKVLVIDDDPVIVKAVTLALHARGYRVLSALDGAEPNPRWCGRSSHLVHRSL